MKRRQRKLRAQKIDGLTMPVMKTACSTCPFVNGHKSGLAGDSINEYTDSLVRFDSQHLCHTADNKAICRGGRELQLRLLAAFGIISEATDAAFDAATREALNR